MPTPYPRNRSLVKTLAEMWKETVSPRRRNQTARVVPFNKNNTRKNNNKNNKKNKNSL